MKMTRNDFYKWAKQRTQWTENELLNPHNPDIADSEIVEVISWQDFVSLIFQITEGKIEITKEENKKNEVTMATLPNDYLNMLFQKEHILTLLLNERKIDLKEIHNELHKEFGESYNGWALKEEVEE